MILAPEEKQVPCAHPCGSVESPGTGATDTPLQLRFGFAGMHGLYQSRAIPCRMKAVDFFDWQGAGGVHSGAMDDERNTARRKKTRSHGMEWLGIGIKPVHPELAGLYILFAKRLNNAISGGPGPALFDPAIPHKP